MELEVVDEEFFILLWDDQNPEWTAENLEKSGFGKFSVTELQNYADGLKAKGIDLAQERRRVKRRLHRAVQLVAKRRATRRRRLLASLKLMN
jgi:hypothetical protein